VASGNIKGINIQLGAETKGLDKALSDVNKRARDSQTELKKVEKLLRLDPKNTELVAQKQKLLGDSIAATREKLDRLKSSQKQVEEQFKSGKIGEDQYRAFQRELVSTEQELKRLETAGKKAGAVVAHAFEDAGAKAQAAGKKLQGVGKDVQGVGTAATKYVTGPLLAASAAAIALGGEIDDAFDRIRIGTGATGPLLDGLKEDFRAVAGSVPASFGDVGIAIADLNTRLGLTGPPLQTLAKQYLELSRITGTDLTGNIEAGAAAFSAFDVPAKDYATSLDFIFKTSQSTGIGIGQLFSEIQSGAPMLRTFGFGFEESAALMGTLKKGGLETGPVLMALKKTFATLAKGDTTALKKALTELSKDGITNADKALAALEKGGSAAAAKGLKELIKLGAKDVPTALKLLGDGTKSPKDLLVNLFDSIKNAPTDLAAGQIALETFGARGAGFAVAIRSGKASYEELLESLKGSDETIGGAASATDDWKESLQKLWNQIKLKLEPVTVKLFNSLNKFIPTIKRVAERVVGLVDAFTRLSPAIRNGVLGFVGVIAVVGPVLVILGSLAGAVGNIIWAIGGLISILPALGTAFVTAFALMTGPAGLAVIALGAVATAVGVLGIEVLTNKELLGRYAVGHDELTEAAHRAEDATNRLRDAEKNIKEAMEKSKVAQDRLKNAHLDAAQSELDLARAKDTLRDAQKAVTGALKAAKGDKTDPAVIEAVRDRTEAEIGLQRAIDGRNKAVKEEHEANREGIIQSQRLREDDRARQKAQNDQIRADAALIDAAKKKAAALGYEKDGYLNLIPPVGQFKDKVERLVEAQKHSSDALGEFSDDLTPKGKAAYLELRDAQTDLARAAEGAVDKVKELGGSVEKLPASKNVKVTVTTSGLANLQNLNTTMKAIASRLGLDFYLRGGISGKPPELAAGAVVTRPMLAIVGERGPEAVVPLNKLPGIIESALRGRQTTAQGVTIPMQNTFYLANDYDAGRAAKVMSQRIRLELAAKGEK